VSISFSGKCLPLFPSEMVVFPPKNELARRLQWSDRQLET